MILYRFTKGYEVSASMTLHTDLNSANECPVYEYTETGSSNNEMVLSSFFTRRATQTSDAVAKQHKFPRNA